MPKISDYINLQPKQQECYQYIGRGYIVFFGGSRGGGKLSPLTSKVCTPKGWVEIGSLNVGDIISDPTTGGSQKVIAIHPQGVKDIYKVTCDDGATCLVGLDHLWSFKRPNHRRPNTKPSKQREFAKEFLGLETPETRWDKLRVGTTEELIGYVKDGERPRIPLSEPILYTVNGRTGKGLVEPYLMGLMIGDGYNKTMTMTTCDVEVTEYLRSVGFAPNRNRLCPNGIVTSWVAKGNIRKSLDQWLRNNNLKNCRSWEKFIPKYVQTSPIDYRYEFLSGLMDTDGYIDDRGHLSYTTTSAQLAKDIQDLVRGLGGKAKITSRIPKYNLSGEKKDGRLAYTVWVYLKKAHGLFRIKRKQDRIKNKWNGGFENMRAIESIKYHSSQEAVCITVDSPHGLYITDDFIVTHNSHLALASGVLSALRFPGMTVGIFRKHFNELVENFIDKLKTLYPPDIFGYTYKEQKKIAYFNNGSKIVFRSAEREVDVDKILGLEYQFIIVDEGNQFQERSIKRMVGSLRNPNIPNWRPTMLMTGNPGGVSDVFFKTHFVNPDYKYWEPAELKVKDKYIFIPATVYDNKILVENDPGYIENLESLPDHLRDAWLHGSWDVFEGRFFSEWNDDVHVITPFDIPPEWKRVCGIDIGFSDRHPSVCVWIAQDPETEDLYVYREYVANQVIEEFALMVAAHSEQEVIDAYYIDTSAFVSNKLRYDDESAARIFLTAGNIVTFPAVKDRLNGWRIFKSWLHWTEKYYPKLRFFRNCEKCSLYLPQLLYAKSDGLSEDCNTDMRDDEADAVRYALATGFGFPGTLKERAEIVIEDKVDKYKKDFFATSPEEGIPLSETYSVKYNNFLIDDPSDGRSMF